MDYEKAYKEALSKAKAYDEAKQRAKHALDCDRNGLVNTDKPLIFSMFPELKESEDERIRKSLIAMLKNDEKCYLKEIAWLEKQKELEDKGEISDGYHTFNELYRYRMLYNAAFFNLLPKEWVHKSKKHNDGEECFGGGWFIVMANLPTGQISNHYELKDWDLFQVPEKEIADKWDGHTPQEAANRLYKYLLESKTNVVPNSQSEDEKIRKDLIEFLDDIWHRGKNADFDKWDKAYCSDWINWLEKQKEKLNFYLFFKPIYPFTESIYKTLENVKARERKELIEKLRLHGKKINDGYEWHFEGECPIVAAYDYDEPCDVVILSVRVDKDENITIIGDEKNDRGNKHDINIDDIFAGHVEFITNDIYISKH